MSSYFATVQWLRGDAVFAKQQYTRGHMWKFDEGLTVPASASPHVVKAPWAVARAVDPEEALVAALASCHMLFFLSDASRAGFMVEKYEDAAEGVMTKNADGRVAITLVTLRPQVTFSGTMPTAEEFAKLHDGAHEQCYIANSIRSEVRLEPEMRSA
jgi:organic hydroperoxide reductase OsmC/OhrA